MPVNNPRMRKRYDSGWFACAAGGTYAKTHGLGTDLVDTALWFRTGSGADPKKVELNLSEVFIDRGDPGTNDYTHANLTGDSTWRDMDLSSIIPAGATAVLLRTTMYDESGTGMTLYFRKNGNSNTINIGGNSVQVITLTNKPEDTLVALDSNRKIEYWLSSTATDSISVNVAGYFMPRAYGATITAMDDADLTVQAADVYVCGTLDSSGVQALHTSGEYRVTAAIIG